MRTSVCAALKSCASVKAACAVSKSTSAADLALSAIITAFERARRAVRIASTVGLDVATAIARLAAINACAASAALLIATVAKLKLAAVIGFRREWRIARCCSALHPKRLALHPFVCAAVLAVSAAAARARMARWTAVSVLAEFALSTAVLAASNAAAGVCVPLPLPPVGDADDEVAPPPPLQPESAMGKQAASDSNFLELERKFSSFA